MDKNHNDDDESGELPHPSINTYPFDNRIKSSDTTQEMVRITGRYDWFDSSAPPMDDLDEKEMTHPVHNTPRGRKFLRKFLPSQILQRRQALFRRLHQAKDFSWALAAVVGIPIGLILPPILLQPQSHHAHTLAQSSMTQGTILVALILALAVALGFNRLLYRTRAGGTVGQSDGDQARHIAAAVLFIMAPLSILTLPLLYVIVRLHAHLSHITRLDHVWIWILLLCTSTQIYIHVSKVWLLGKRKKKYSRSLDSLEDPQPQSMEVDMTSAGRRILFKQLVVTSLDILSRILRHKSFAQTVSRMLIVQWLFVVAWANSLLHLLYNDVERNNYFWIFLSTWMGLLGSAIVRRILGYIASGGVTLWLETQHNAVLARENEENESNKNTSSGNDTSSTPVRSTNPYGPLLASDDDDENDDSDDNDDDMIDHDLVLNESHSPQTIKDSDDFDEPKKRSSWFDPMQGLSDLSSSIGLPRNITLRTLFSGAVSLSLGSVVLCATSAAVSRWILHMLTRIDNSRSKREGQEEEIKFSNQEAFRPMPVGGVQDSPTNKSILSRIEAFVLHFSRHYSDCGLGHAAAYVKSYRVASSDVMNRLVETDLTLLVVDDISAHLCASVSFVLAGICTLFASFVFQTRHGHLGEEAKCIVLLISFLLSFSLIDTVMEPIRVSILSIYVSLAFHPLALKHSFPLLYQRLHRIRKTSSNLV